MQIIKIILAIILFVALQGLLSNYIEEFKRLDLPLILIVYLSLKRNPMQGTLVGATTGYLYDLIAGVGLLGASSFTKTIIGFTTATINVRFAIDNKLTRLIVMVIASIVNVMLFIGLHYVFNSLPEGLNLREIIKLTVWQAAGNLIISFLLFPVFDKIFAHNPYSVSTGAGNW
ncbi:MAG: rod shape-determining protein MreD [Acidobacteria bacterium]|nr:rod shape-determining protein MreD [Acidobacteriota bacterium]